jgi:hypothetical protein
MSSESLHRPAVAFVQTPLFLVASTLFIQIVISRIALKLLNRLPSPHHYHTYDTEKKRSIATQIAISFPKLPIFFYWLPILVLRDIWSAQHSQLMEEFRQVR